MRKGDSGIIITVLILLILITVLLVFLFLQIWIPGNDNYNQQDFRVKEKCKEIIIPYTVQESYIEEEPYTFFKRVRREFDYKSEGNHEKIISGTQVQEKGIVRVKNLEYDKGDFTVIMRFKTSSGVIEKKQTKRIGSRDKEIFESFVDIKLNDSIGWEYEIIPEEDIDRRPITFIQQIIKTRPITKYLTETYCDELE